MDSMINQATTLRLMAAIYGSRPNAPQMSAAALMEREPVKTAPGIAVAAAQLPELQVRRELGSTQSLGFGTFDRFVYPPEAVIETVRQEGTEITVRAGVTMMLKAGRGYHRVNEPLTHTTTRGLASSPTLRTWFCWSMSMTSSTAS